MMNGNAAFDLSKIQTVKQADYLPASNNKRVIAFILDTIFVAAAQKVALFPFHLTTPTSKLVGMVVFFYVAAFFYWSLTTHKWGGTPGKLALGLRVIGADGQETVGLGRLFYRETIGRFCSAFPLCLGYLWVSWDKNRQTFHDKIAKTRVIDYKN